jgi:hypothetical protein
MCLVSFGGIQPVMFVQYLRDPKTNLAADGMLFRYQLLVYPSIPARRRHVDEPANVEAKNRCFYILKRLAFDDMCAAFGAHAPNELNRVPWFHFSVEAKGLWEDWLDRNECKVLDKNEPVIIREHLSKYPKLLCALAAIFHVIELADKDQKDGYIPKHCVEWAIAWCEYLESHIRRIHEMVSSPSLASAAVLADKLGSPETKTHLETGFTERDVARRCWKGVDTDGLVASALARLEEMHWIRRVKVGPGPKGGHPTCKYEINPAILERRKGGPK